MVKRLVTRNACRAESCTCSIPASVPRGNGRGADTLCAEVAAGWEQRPGSQRPLQGRINSRRSSSGPKCGAGKGGGGEGGAHGLREGMCRGGGEGHTKNGKRERRWRG